MPGTALAENFLICFDFGVLRCTGRVFKIDPAAPVGKIMGFVIIVRIFDIKFV